MDRAKAFYTEQAGFNADHDHAVSDEIRFVQLTPPGSACSISLGKGIVDTPPGSVQGLMLVVPDVQAARAELAERGVEVSEVQEFPWGSFVFFSDPDGNGWAVQQIPDRSYRAAAQCAYFAVTVEHDLNWDGCARDARAGRVGRPRELHGRRSWTRASSCSADRWATATRV